MIASSCGHADIVRTLTEAGADVNKLDESGYTEMQSQQVAVKNVDQSRKYYDDYYQNSLASIRSTIPLHFTNMFNLQCFVK